MSNRKRKPGSGKRPWSGPKLPEILIEHAFSGRSSQAAGGDVMPAKKSSGGRDYRKEYREYHGKPEQIAARSQRNAARAKLGLKGGDPRECDHKNPISNGGSNRRDNLRAVARSTNRRKGASRR